MLIRIIRGTGRLVLAFGRKRAVATNVHEVVEETRKGVQSFGVAADSSFSKKGYHPTPPRYKARASVCSLLAAPLAYSDFSMLVGLTRGPRRTNRANMNI